MWEATTSIGISALLNMVLSIVLIAVSWWALQTFKFDLFIRDINSSQSKMLQILLSIAIGHSVARFFVDYMQWTQLITYLF